MKNNTYLNESSIRHALENGHITRQEAREMMMVYLKKIDFALMKHPTIQRDHPSIQKHY